MFNMTRILELTLFGGRDPQTGEQIGLATPPLDQMARFAELEAAYDAQLVHFVELMVEGCNVVDAHSRRAAAVALPLAGRPGLHRAAAST